MKKWVKAVNLFLIIGMIASMLPTFVQATEIVASGYSGGEGNENFRWDLDSEGTLIFSGTGILKKGADTFFYRDASGDVRQTPQQTFSGAIDCIALRDCRIYFNNVGDFNASHVLYMAKDAATVQGYTYSYVSF